MDDPVLQRAHALISKYKSLSEEQKRKHGRALAEKISDSHAWLDLAIEWFNKPDDNGTRASSGPSVSVTCPCGKKLRLSV